MDVNRRNGVSEAIAKKEVSIFVQIPSLYIGKIECAVNAETVEIRSLECDCVEIDAKTPHIVLEDVSGTVEINCNLDMEVVCHSLNGELDINQVSATSKIYIPEDTIFDHFRTAVGKCFRRQCIKRVKVAEHEAGLIEGTCQVLAGGKVHRGLSSDRGIHLG